jgi:hypothetical protein
VLELLVDFDELEELEELDVFDELVLDDLLLMLEIFDVE